MITRARVRGGAETMAANALARARELTIGVPA